MTQHVSTNQNAITSLRSQSRQLTLKNLGRKKGDTMPTENQSAIDRLRKQARQLILNGLNEKLELNILHALVQERRLIQYKSYTFELNTDNLEDIQASTHKVSESDSRIFYLDLNIPSMNEPQQIAFSENDILNALHEIGVPASAYDIDYKISKRESCLDTSSKALPASMLYDIKLNPYHVQKIITIDLTQVPQD